MPTYEDKSRSKSLEFSLKSLLLLNLRISIFFILMIQLFSIKLFATELANDTFQNNSNSGYSIDDGWKNQLKISHTHKSYKIYDFGSAFANQPLTITFKMKWKGNWESSGKWKDYFKAYFNESKKIDDSFSGDASNWHNYSITTNADSSGKLKVEFYTDTTANSEYLVIDDVIVSSTLTDEVTVEKTVNNSTPQVNDIVTFSITTTNRGISKKIEMRDWIESGQYGTTANAFEIISYSVDKSNVTCSIDSVGGNPFLYCVSDVNYVNNESFTITVQAKILKSAQICNEAYGYKYPWDTSVMDSSIVCFDASVPDETMPPDETIPTDDADPIEPICNTFSDMFQTHMACNGSNGGAISFDNASSTLDGSDYIITSNSDNTLNTCLVETKDWVENQYETCGEKGDCVATEKAGKTLSINYSNPPLQATIDASPSSSTNDVELNSNQTLSEYEYNNITTSYHTGIITTFDITNSLKINSLKMTTDNTFNFNSTNPYSLEIGTLGIENNGANNTIATDTNAKNIKIHTFDLAANTTLTLQAIQTIKMDSFTVGRGSSVMLKAQHININNFTSSNSGSGNSVIDIYADYIDITNLTLNQTVTLNIHPFTSGKRILFRVNNLYESSSSSILISSGNYYINNTLTIPGTSNVSAIRALDENQLINLYINSDLTLGNNPGINAEGNNGNYFTNFPANNFMIFINGNLTTGGGGTTINATIYIEGDATLGNPTYIKGALNANSTINIGQGQFVYDQNISNTGWGKCGESYCSNNGLSEGFHIIDPDGGDDKNSFEIFCHKDSDGNWHELIALPIKNDSNNFVFDNNTTSSNYYDTTANPRTPFHAIEVDINNITYSATLDNGAPKPLIPVVVSSGSQPYEITTSGKNYRVMGSTFSNINLIGTPFTIDWNNTDPLEDCDESALRKALGQAVKYNTLTGDGRSICKIKNMKLSLLNNYRYLSYNGKEVLQHSCKEMAAYVPDNLGILDDEDIDGYFNILTSEPAYPGLTIPQTNGNRNNSTDLGDSNRPITVYCKYQTDLNYVWTFLTALDGEVTVSKNDLVNHNDTCSKLGLYFFVPNSKDTFNRVREYLKSSKTGIDGWENYTGTIEEKIRALHPGNTYYLSAFRDVLIWPYGPMGVYYPTDGWQSGANSWYGGSRDVRGWMSGSPMHNIKTMSNYNDSMGAKGFVSILGSQDLNKTDDWWIADIGAGEEIGNSSPQYNPHGTHPIQSEGYKYYEPNGNYTANAWLNFLFDSEGWVYHNDDWYNNYPYYDYMCMSETNYDDAIRYKVLPGRFNVEEKSIFENNNSNHNITTQIVKKFGDFLVTSYDPNDLESFKNISTIVAIELVQIPENSNISENDYKDLNVLTPRIWVEFNNESKINFNKSTLETAINEQSIFNGSLGSAEDFFKTANKNVAFRISYNSMDDYGSIPFLNSSAGNNNNNYTITNWHNRWQGENCTVDMSQIPFNNKNSNKVSTYCSGNLDKKGVLLCMECIYGKDTRFMLSRDNFAIRPDKFLINLPNDSIKAGEDFNITFKALNDLGESSLEYNESINSSFKVEANETKIGCIKGTFSLNNFTFLDGNASDINLSYDEVGDINLTIQEINGNEFAIVDSDDTPNEQRFISPTSKIVTITPHHFKVDTTLSSGGSNYTYISNDLNMSTTLNIDIIAQTENNSTTTNYNSACYAQDIDLNISYDDLNITPSGAITKLIYVEDTNVTTSAEVSINSNISLVKPKGVFTTDNNGTASLKLKVNFDRNETVGVNPFRLAIRDINITDTNGTFGNKDLNQTNLFYYGRVHAPDQRFDDVSGESKIYYEVYCDGCNKSEYNINGDESIDSIGWYINTLHSSLSDGNVSKYTSASDVKFGSTDYNSATLETSSNNITNGKESITIVAPKTPYKDKIAFTSSPWLVFSPTDFIVEFFSANGNWAGQGLQGKTIDLNISKRQNQRLDW